jgi:outer membrane protein assembly factor BamB
VYSSPAVGNSGTIYVGLGNDLYALNDSTALSWQFQTGAGITTSPAIGSDGTVYFSSDDGKVYAIAASQPPAASPWPMLGRNSRRTASAQITGLPRILATPTASDFAVGTTASLSVLASGTGPLTYRWQKGGIDITNSVRIAGADSNWLRITGLTLEDTGEYSVIVANAEGSTASSAATLTAHPAQPGELRWTFRANAGFASSPAIGSNGTIYIGASNAKLYAFDGASGRKLWDFQADRAINSSPSIGADGTVYFGDGGYYGDTVYAIDGATGAKKWDFDTSASVDSSPAIGIDGTVFVGSFNDRIYAFDGATGATKWEFLTGGDVASSPAIAPDGTVYVGSWDKKVYALDGATGVEKWEFMTGGSVDSSPAIAADGTVYVGSWDEKVYALDGATGAKKWEFVTGNAVSSSPAIAADGTVYVGSWDRKVYALDGATGAMKWEFVTGNAVSSSPAIAADGTVYVGSWDKKVYALDGASGAKKWEFEAGDKIESSPAIGNDGTVYFGSTDGQVYALFGASPLAVSSWPMRGRNAKHTATSEITGPIRILVPPTDLEGALGASTKLGVIAGGSQPLSYQWQKDGQDLVDSERVEGANRSVLRLVNLHPEDAGLYRVDVSNAAGSTLSPEARLTLRAGIPGELRWSYAADGPISSSPAIGADGTVYVGSWDKKVYALNGATGAKKWEFMTGDSVDSSPAIGADGTVYVGSQDNKVYALDGATGALKWNFLAGYWNDSSPAIGADGTVYVGSFDGKVYALDGATGAKKWEFLTGDSVDSSPAIGAEGTVYVGSRDKIVYALNGATGAKKWEFLTGDSVDSSPAIGAEGTVYVGSGDGKVYALNRATGAKRWEFLTGDLAGSSPAIGADGTVYVGSYDSKVYALDGITGVKRWEFVTGGAIFSSPAIGVDGTVYVGSMDDKFYALDRATGAMKWEFVTGENIDSSPAIGADSTIYVGSNDGGLYALFGSSPLADSPWPMRGRNPLHTGRAISDAPLILLQPVGITATPGSSVLLSVLAEGRGTLRYQWRLNGQTLPGADQFTLTLEQVSQADVGEYEVVVSNDHASVTSIPAALSLISANQAPLFVKGPDQSLPEGAGAQSVVGWATAISAGPTNEISQALTFVVTHDNEALFATQPAITPEGTLTFTPAPEASGTATVSVVLKDDGGTANGGQDTSAAQTFVITGLPVNDAPVFVKGPDQSLPEGAGAQSVVGWATAISAGPTNEISQTLAFVVTHDNEALFATPPAITPEGTLTFTPAPDASGTATVSVVLKDDGGTANGGQDTSAAQTFVITVLPVNDAPVFVKGPDHSVREDAGPQTVPAWATAISAGPTNEISQALTFVVTPDNEALFATPPAITAEGTLTFTPAPEASGTATVSVVLKDDGGTANGGQDTSAAQTFVITGLPVNDAPAFVKGPDQSLPEGAGAQSVIGWATAISAGPTNEISQTLAFVVTHDNEALFATQPAITAEGTLTFTPAPEASGTATVSVVLKDDGGTANGGQDTSAAQTFVITGLPVNDAPVFVKGPDQSLPEDAGAQSVVGWATGITAGPTNEVSQTLAFVATHDNEALFATPPAITSEGNLTFTPAPDASGTATVSMVLKDDGGTENGGQDTSAAQTFVITVLPVNDAPVFVKGPDQSLSEGAGAQSVVGWATAISAGPTNEMSQALSFALTNDNQALFATPPAITPEGTLTFTPAPDVSGTATVSVVLKDEGGTANGGQDTSAAQTLLIEMISTDPPQISSIGWVQGQLEIRWEDDHLLQWASDPAGPWVDLPEARSPFVIVLETGHRFYRLKANLRR